MKNRILFFRREIKNVASKGFFYLFTAQGFILLIGFASQLFVAEFLGPTDIGRIKIMQTYLNVAVLVCGLGFNIALLKIASEEIELEMRKRLYRTAFMVTLISFLVIYSLFYLLSVLDFLSSDFVISHAFPLYLLFLLPLALQSIQMAYYQSGFKIKRLAKMQFVIKTVTIFAIVISTKFFGLNGYIISIVVTGFITVVIFEIDIKNLKFKLEYLKPDFTLFKEMWYYARYVLLANITAIMVSTIDVYIINYVVHERMEVGYYMFALTAVSVFQLIPATIQQISFPFFSQQSSNYDRWYESYQKYNKLNHVLSIIVVAVGLALFPILIKYFFSGKYDRSVYYFIFLSIAWMIKSSSLIKSTAIIGQGRFDINFRASLIILLLSFPIVFVLINRFALDGALAGMIIASVISYVTVSIMFARFNKKILRGD